MPSPHATPNHSTCRTFRSRLSKRHNGTRVGDVSSGGGLPSGRSGAGASGRRVSAAALRQALAQAYLSLDQSFCAAAQQSGCTLTTAVVAGRLLTVANVGDSAAYLDTGACCAAIRGHGCCLPGSATWYCRMPPHGTARYHHMGPRARPFGRLPTRCCHRASHPAPLRRPALGPGSELLQLTTSHRLCENPAEVARLCAGKSRTSCR